MTASTFYLSAYKNNWCSRLPRRPPATQLHNCTERRYHSRSRANLLWVLASTEKGKNQSQINATESGGYEYPDFLWSEIRPAASGG